MNIIVCIKQVPDTAAEIVPAADGSAIRSEDLPWVMNPYDEYALEEALRMREGAGGVVTAVCMGPAGAEAALRSAAAMGADQLVHLLDPAFAGADAQATAAVLAAAVRGMDCDLIWCGKMAVDDASACVGTALGELLGLPHIAGVVAVEIADRQVTARRETEAGTQVLRCPLPAVLTAEKGLNEPRYPKAIDIMKAKRREVTVVEAAALGVSPQQAGAAAAPTRVTRFDAPPARSGGTVIEGPAAEAAARLVRCLREEAKVI